MGREGRRGRADAARFAPRSSGRSAPSPRTPGCWRAVASSSPPTRRARRCPPTSRPRRSAWWPRTRRAPSSRRSSSAGVNPQPDGRDPQPLLPRRGARRRVRPRTPRAVSLRDPQPECPLPPRRPLAQPLRRSGDVRVHHRAHRRARGTLPGQLDPPHARHHRPRRARRFGEPIYLEAAANFCRAHGPGARTLLIEQTIERLAVNVRLAKSSERASPGSSTSRASESLIERRNQTPPRSPIGSGRAEPRARRRAAATPGFLPSRKDWRSAAPAPVLQER